MASTFIIWGAATSVFGQTQLRGSVSLVQDYYFRNAAFENQKNQHSPTIEIQPEYIWQSDMSQDAFLFEPFLALSATDPAKNRFDIRKASYQYVGDMLEVEFGVSKVFWGVAESRHLVDIVNQTDMMGNVDGEDKLGQPMIKAGYYSDYGWFQAFILPYFRTRTFSHKESRLRQGFILHENEAEFSNHLEEYHPDFALRYQNNFDDLDLGLHYFYGTDREPVINARISGGGVTYIPRYDIIHRVGLDAQYTIGGWLLKSEAIAVQGYEDIYYAATNGFEYTFYGIEDTDIDIGMLVEYHHDDRSSQMPITFYDHDLFIGTRITPNDLYDTEFLAGFLTDVKGEGNIWSLETSRRLSDHFKLSLEARLFHGRPKDDLFRPFDRDDFVRLELNYFF